MDTDVIDPPMEEYEETAAEKSAREASEVVLDETSQKFVDSLVEKLLVVCDQLAGFPLYPYQKPLAARILESLIINDGETITALWARQSGKTETISTAIAVAMIMLPRLARAFPTLLSKYERGVWVGAFAPVEEQADNLFGRIVQRLNSAPAKAIMADPEINERIIGRGKVVYLKNCGSEVRKTTCHPRATIEGRTYHIILIDESQFADDHVINKSVSPMGTATNASMIMTGTPTYSKNVFWKIIQMNKRRAAIRGQKRQNHFEVDWKEAGKYNKNYLKRTNREMLRLGEDSNEFKLSYRCMWLLDQGMFTTSERLEALGDKSMQSLVWAHNSSPVVAGIDCGRKHDRTVVTVVYVDWDNPDQFNSYHHHVLAWRDLENMDWEEQYFRIKEFLSNYNVLKIGIDVGGLGDVVAQRLRVIMPYAEIVDMPSNPGEQSRRWKHLFKLMEQGQIAWPAGAKVRNLKVYKRFIQEMQDLELQYKGPNMMAMAPKEADAHDDYPDSLALACILTLEDEENSEVLQFDNFFYRP